MIRFLILLVVLTARAADPWKMDVGGYLQFPIPAGTTTLANDFTPIIGGGGDFHWWISDKIGVGLKSSADYLSDMKQNIDLIELTHLAQVNYRFSFSHNSFASLGIEGGKTFHFYRSRGEQSAKNGSAGVAGGFVALPVRVHPRFVVGPHAESLLQFFKDENNEWNRPEWYVAIGVTAAFIRDRK